MIRRATQYIQSLYTVNGVTYWGAFWFDVLYAALIGIVTAMFLAVFVWP